MKIAMKIRAGIFSLAALIASAAFAQSPPFNAYSIGTLGGNCSDPSAVPYQNASGATECTAPGTPGQALMLSGAVPTWTAVPGTGTVTSVGLVLPSEFTVTGSPVTAAGDLTGAWAAQFPNYVLAGPPSVAGTPSFRALIGADLPNPSSTTKGGVKSYTSPANQWINSIATDGTPSSSQPGFSSISGTASIAQGGTGQTTANAAFNALSPVTTQGDLIYRNATVNARLPIGTSGQLLGSDGTSPVWQSFVQSGTGAIARNWQIKVGERVSIVDYGADGTAANDDLAFSRANTYLNSIGGGTIVVPPGTWQVSATTTLSTRVSVKCEGSATIQTTHTTNVMFVITSYTAIDGCNFTTSVTRTDSPAIQMTDATQVHIARNIFTGFRRTIYILEASYLIWIDENSFYIEPDPSAIGIYITATGSGGNEVFLTRNWMRSQTAVQPGSCIRINHTNAVYMEGNSLFICGNALYINPQAGRHVTWIFSRGDVFDTSTRGIYINGAATAFINGVQFIGGWSSGHTGNGIELSGSAGINGVDFIGMRVFENDGHGLDVQTGVNVRVTDSAFAGNSAATPGTFNGINFAAGVSGFIANDNFSGEGYGYPANQSYGIAVQAGAGNDYIITGNRNPNNATGTILDGGTGPSKVVANNL